MFNAAFRVSSITTLEKAVSGQALRMPLDLVKEFSPDAMAIMEFAAQPDIDVCRKMYLRQPKFGERIPGQPNRVYMAEAHMGSNRDLFTEDTDGLPLFEGRMVGRYDYRAKGYNAGRGRAADWIDFPFGDPNKRVAPQWHIKSNCVPRKLTDKIRLYRIGFCDVVNPATEKCLLAALIPPNAICGHSVPTILFENGTFEDLLLWIAVANSLVMDFLVRKKVRLHMTYTIIDSLPFPRGWRTIPAASEIIKRSFSLSAVGPEMEDFRRIMRGSSEGGISESPTEDPDIRAQKIAEIEVLVARGVFGLTLSDVQYVLNPATVLGPDCGVEAFRVYLRNVSAVASENTAPNGLLLRLGAD